MSKTIDPKPQLLQWTRVGGVAGAWGAFQTFEELVFTPSVQAALQKLAVGFMSSQEVCRQARLPWRRGAFVFGPPGTGKSAAGRAISLLLGWTHVTLPAFEILDTHHLARALVESVALAPAVVILDNIDEIFKRMDPKNFFDLFDAVSEKADGIFWIATTRRPEDVPKSQLVRPGRFEEPLRLMAPSSEVKAKYYEGYLEPFLKPDAATKQEHLALLEANPTLTYAHLFEMRLTVAKALMDGDPDRLLGAFQTFVQEQMVGGDRFGGLAVGSMELEERVKTADPRLLASALEVTDAFKRVVEMTVSSATETLLAAQAEVKK